MATEKPANAMKLSEEEIKQLSSEVVDKIFGAGSSSLAKLLKAQLADTRSLNTSLETSRASSAASSTDSQKLDILEWLDKLSEERVSFVTFCISRVSLDDVFNEADTVTAKRELAAKIIKLSVDSPDTLSSTNEFSQARVKFFTAEATTVLLSLIDSGDIPVLPEECKSYVVAVLRGAIEATNFDIAKQSIRTLVPYGNLENSSELFRAANVPQDKWAAVTTYLFNLQRLQAFVNDPIEVGVLMRCGFTSAESVAERGSRALSSILQQGISRESAVKICSQAQFIARRNEHLYTTALALRGSGSRADVNLAAIGSQAAISREEINLSTMFGVNSVGCDDCSSLTGPAAFFVDLLHKLSRIDLASKDSVLDKLFERRPDLGDLGLSCANTNKLVPYVDLVNEVLESVVWNLAKNESLIPPFNSSEEDTDESCFMQPQTTNFEVYSEIIQPVVSPLHTFPYNQAIQSTRAYLTSLGSSRFAMLQAFRSPYSVTQNPDLFSEVEMTLNYAAAAEVLNLQHEDFAAITKRGICTFKLARALYDEEMTLLDYALIFGVKDPGSLYWGFSADELMAPNVPDSDIGLTNVLHELLPRSGLSFPDLLALTKTAYMRGRLTIEIKRKEDGEEPSSSELLEYMRLREWKDGIVKPLKASTCHDMQVFLRLWRKVQWPMEELDAVFSMLSARYLAGVVYPKLLDHLAAIKRLSELTNYSPSELQPLWGDMNTHGTNSLYSRLFLTPVLPAQTRGALSGIGSGQTKNGADDVLLLPTLLMGLGMTEVEFQFIKALMGSSDLELNIANVSALYRVSTLCRILQISIEEYSRVMMLYPAGFDPFKDPPTTLTLVESYLPLQPNMKHWTLDRLLFATRKVPGVIDTACQPSINGHIEIIDSVRCSLNDPALDDMEKSMKSCEALEGILKQLIPNAEAREAVLSFIQGAVKASINMSEAQCFIENLEIVLGTEEATSLYQRMINHAPETSRQSIFLDAFLPAQYREQQRQAVLKTLTSRFPNLSMALLQFSLEKLIAVKLDSEAKSSDMRSGMDIFLGLVNPEDPITGPFAGYFCPPTTDSYSIMCAGETEPQEVLLDEALLKFEEQIPGQKPRWAATTNPLTGGQWYPFQCSGNPTELTWCVAGTRGQGAVPMTFTQTELIGKTTVDLVAPVVVDLMRISLLVSQFRVQSAELEFSTVIQYVMASRKVDRFVFDQLTLRDILTLERYLELREKFSRAGSTLPLLGLYKWLFSFAQGKTEPASEVQDELLTQLASATGWSQDLCNQYFRSKYPHYNADQIIKVFQDVSALYEMQTAVQFWQDLGLPSLSLESLFTMSSVPGKDFNEHEFGNAATLRLAIQARRFPPPSGGGRTALSEASDCIRDSQRSALVQYLLCTDYAQEHSLSEADRLFGHFLIDVQMGPGLQTSRIKQAISSVQLFSQRCALGLEDGIGSDFLSRADLEYMLRYRLWEADRKAYLYPENWADATLRDNKTPEFQELESQVMQTRLDSESISNLIKQYVLSVEKTANLKVEAYVIDRDVERKQDTFHIFARTRQSPITFYYRNVSVGFLRQRIKAPTWSPWAQINVEITMQDVDTLGKPLTWPGIFIAPVVFRGRLYLFLPEVTIAQTNSSDDRSYSDIAKGKVAENAPNKRVEIRMSFTELHNGTWAPKIQCQSVIKIETHSDFALPVEWLKFKIDPPDKNTTHLTIAVEWTGIRLTTMRAYILGYFQIRSQHLILSLSKDSLPVPEVHWTDGMILSGITFKNTFSRFIDTDPGSNLPRPNSMNYEVSQGHNSTLVVKTHNNGLSNSKWEWVLDFAYPKKSCHSALIYETSTPKDIEQFITLDVDHDFRTERMFNRVAHLLAESSQQDDGLDRVFKRLSQIQAVDLHEDAFGRWVEKIIPIPQRASEEEEEEEVTRYHERAAPFAVYNWELGVHIPLLIVERLMATQQFELALKVIRLVFDPSMDGEGIDRCWSFPPFREDSVRKPSFSLDEETPVNEWKASGGNVHAAARGSPVAYMKRFAMKYVEILIGLGDEYFRRDTLESIMLAIQMYTEASFVFGPQPVELPQLGKRAVKTFNDLKAELTDLSNATVDLELDHPFYIRPGTRGASIDINQPRRGSLRSGYFCIQGNPHLVDLRGRIDDRLYKIRNGMDINGKKRTLALFEPPIDPGDLQRAKFSSSDGIAGFLSNLESPMPRYRFRALIDFAMEFASELKGASEKALGMKLDKDGEGLALLQAKHERTVLGLSMRVSQHQMAQVTKAKEALQMTRKQTGMKLAYILALTGDNREIPAPGEEWKDIPQSIEKPTSDDFRMSPFEKQQMAKADEAFYLMASAQVMTAAAASSYLAPDVAANAQPLGTGVSTSFGGSNIGKNLEATAEVAKLFSARATHSGEQAGRKGDAIQKLQDRRSEANSLGLDLMRMDTEIAAQDVELETYEAEMLAQQEEFENAAAEEEWLRNKYTNLELYNHLDNVMGVLFHRTYLMAMEMAKKAKRALDFELSLQSTTNGNTNLIAPTLANGYWETSRDGYLSGEALLLDLRQMASFYREANTHDFELEKRISLREINPRALLNLQEFCETEFEIPEVLFDMDFPGHFCRRIYTVAMSTRVDNGDAPVNLNYTLTLQKHKYRISSTADGYDQQKAASFRTDRIPISSVAMSRQTEDRGGTWQYPNNDWYGPFEGAGAISSWRISLPSTLPQFDYGKITDVVMHMQYTSFNSGGLLESSASEALKTWSQKANAASSSTSEYGQVPKTLAINLLEEEPEEPEESSQLSAETPIELKALAERLPFWARAKNSIQSDHVTLLVTPEPSGPLPALYGPNKQEGVKGTNVGAYSVYEFERSLDMAVPWKIENLKHGEFERAWLLIDYSA
ncbi:hypothetical protein N7452_010829 [Penicillium brevicompactum]|uniref:Uncharacterized protein n=1 Tax=Penicillium brevicompactum TaxID=5074 RepID=A0A9W9Q119_PENBR|nr:hypothetical protein N7452_010829 [Penicillium brevicompactum]